MAERKEAGMSETKPYVWNSSITPERRAEVRKAMEAKGYPALAPALSDPDALSLSRSELPEEIEKAIDDLVTAAEDMGASYDAKGFPAPEREAVANEYRSALTAAILSRLGEVEARREEAQGAPSGPGSQASPEALSDLRPAGVDPSRVGAIHAVAEAWASIDGKMEAFRRERDEGIGYDDPTYTGHYEGYLVEAESLIRRVWRRGFSVVPRQDAQGMEARKGRGEDSVEDDSPVAEGHAPDLTEAGRLAIKDA